VCFAVIVLSLLFLAALATPAFAQEATIVGTVTDPSGAAVADAKVTLTNSDTGVSKVISTNDAGQFVAVDIHIGHYDIKVEKGGFKTEERKGMVLQVGDCTRTDFAFSVGGSQETVTVEPTRSRYRPIPVRSATSLPASKSRISRLTDAAFTSSLPWHLERPARLIPLPRTPQLAAALASSSTACARITTCIFWMAAKTPIAAVPAA